MKWKWNSKLDLNTADIMWIKSTCPLICCYKENEQFSYRQAWKSLIFYLSLVELDQILFYMLSNWCRGLAFRLSSGYSALLYFRSLFLIVDLLYNIARILELHWNRYQQWKFLPGEIQLEALICALNRAKVSTDGQYAGLAQLVARQSHNLKVVSSSLTFRITFCFAL